jgi:hypothetical protein
VNSKTTMDQVHTGSATTGAPEAQHPINRRAASAEGGVGDGSGSRRVRRGRPGEWT